jgi:hypothetical protein
MHFEISSVHSALFFLGPDTFLSTQLLSILNVFYSVACITIKLLFLSIFILRFLNRTQKDKGFGNELY